MILGLFSHSANIFVKGKKEKKETRYPLFSWKFFLKKRDPIHWLLQSYPANLLRGRFIALVVQGLYTCPTCCTRLVHLSNAGQTIFTSNPLLISTRSPELKNQHCVAMFWCHNEHNLFLFLFWCFKLHSMQYTVHYNSWELVIESCPTVIWILVNMQSKVQYGWSLYYRCHFALKTHSETLFGVNDRLPDVSLG